MKRTLLAFLILVASSAIAADDFGLYFAATHIGTPVSIPKPNGGTNNDYRMLGPAKFSVRDCGIEPFDDGAGNIVLYTLAVAGRFEGTQPQFPYLLARLDTTWYISNFDPKPVPNSPDRLLGAGNIKLIPSDVFFVFQPRTKTEAERLLKHFESMKPTR